MNAEELLIYIKECVENLDIDGEPIILPTKGDPTKPQNRVSFIIMEKVKKGTIPRFIIHVEDMEAMRKEKNG
jgi:hypothetical protein